MRLWIPPVLAVIYFGWIIRLAIKKEIKKHLHDIFGGLIFFGIWAVIYWLIFKA